MAIQEIEDRNQSYFPYMLVTREMPKTILSFINSNKKIKKMPSDVKSLGIDPDHYKRAMQYAFDKLAFEMYVYSVKTGLDCIFSLTYVMPLVWNSVTKLFPFIEPTSEFQRGFMFLLLEALKSKFIDVPIALYETFVIEEKYGFNKKTLVLFFNDMVIEAGLSVIIIPAVLYGYIYVVDKSEANEWFFFNVEIFLILVTLAIITIYPNFIAPLFNKFKELEDGELKQDINELAININFPLKNILKMDGSRRSDHSNAYFFGLWKNKRIVLYDTLLQQMSQNEIMAVVGHELGHWKNEHSKVNFLIYCARILVLFSLFSFFRNSDSIFLSFGFSDKSTFIGTALFFNLFAPINSVIEILSLVITRYFEFQADIYACNLGYGYYLMSGLTKIQKENVSTLNPDPWYAWFKYSHPGLFERLKRIKQRLFQIELQNGMDNQQIQEKIQDFLEEYVSFSGKNHRSQNESTNYIVNSSSKKKQLGSEFQGYIKEHSSQINNTQKNNPLYSALDRNGSNSLNSSMQYPLNKSATINLGGEIDSNSNQMGYQQVLNNNNTLITNFANANTNSGFNLNLLFNYEQQQKQQQQYLMHQYSFQRLQMQQQLLQDQQNLLNHLTNQSYFQQSQHIPNPNAPLQLPTAAAAAGILPLQHTQQAIQAINGLKNNSQHSNSSGSFMFNSRKHYKHSVSNIESIDSHEYSSSVDINNPNKKLYKEDVYLFGGSFPSNDIRKRQILGNSSIPQSPPEFNINNNLNTNGFIANENQTFLNNPFSRDNHEQHNHNQIGGTNHSPSLSATQSKVIHRNGNSNENGKSNRVGNKNITYTNNLFNGYETSNNNNNNNNNNNHKYISTNGSIPNGNNNNYNNNNYSNNNNNNNNNNNQNSHH